MLTYFLTPNILLPDLEHLWWVRHDQLRPWHCLHHNLGMVRAVFIPLYQEGEHLPPASKILHKFRGFLLCTVPLMLCQMHAGFSFLSSCLSLPLDLMP